MADRGSVRAVGELLRLPLLSTALSDPLAGAFLASPDPPAGPVLAALAAGGFLYAAGMVTNDLADLRKDRRRHPHRPLPSGRIRPLSAWILAGILVSGGLGAGLLAGRRPFATSCALVGAIALYNGGAKRAGILGCAIMGACRGMNLLLGSLAAGGATWTPAAILAAYGAAVTAASLGEDRPFRPRRFAATAPLWILFPAAVASTAEAPLRGIVAAGPLAVWLGMALEGTRRGSEGRGHVLEAFTRRALAAIHLLDAGLLLAAGSVAAAGPLALWGLGAGLGRLSGTSLSPSSPPPSREEVAPPASPCSPAPPSSPSADRDGSCR